MSLPAGQGVALVGDVRPAAEVVRDLVRGAAALIRDRPSACVADAAPA